MTRATATGSTATGSTAMALYATRIRHLRLEPIRNEFEYRSYWWLVDLDHVPPPRRWRSFEARDHCGDPARTLRQNIEDFLADRGVELDGGRILMATSARSFGHVFNPLTMYWCFSGSGDATALCRVIAEVHNTYGGRHRYLLDPDEHARAETAKSFYVSPFNEVDGTYRIAAPAPGDRLRVGVTLQRDGTAPFVTSVSGERMPISSAAALRACAIGSTRRTSALIRRQGIGLWLRRLPLVPQPGPSKEAV